MQDDAYEKMRKNKSGSGNPKTDPKGRPVR